MTIIIGITGGIATGKSTATRLLRLLQVPVFDADATVHHLLRHNKEMVASIKEVFPNAVECGAVNRDSLGAIVFASEEARNQLEQRIHPHVRKAQKQFIDKANMRREPFIALDIPLLFETGADAECDVVWVIDCPAFLQQQRVLRRAGMTIEKWQQINAIQMPQAQKRHLADSIIHSGMGKGAMLRQLKQLLAELKHA